LAARRSGAAAARLLRRREPSRIASLRPGALVILILILAARKPSNKRRRTSLLLLQSLGLLRLLPSLARCPLKPRFALPLLLVFGFDSLLHPLHLFQALHPLLLRELVASSLGVSQPLRLPRLLRCFGALLGGLLAVQNGLRVGSLGRQVRNLFGFLTCCPRNLFGFGLLGLWKERAVDAQKKGANQGVRRGQLR
jgi:hypothetical protein